MPILKVPLPEAETVKQILIKHQFLDKTRGIVRTKTSVYYPVKDIPGAKQAVGQHVPDAISLSWSKKKMPLRKEITTLRGALSSALTTAEQEVLKTSYDSIGNIAILEIPAELQAKERHIAQTLLTLNKSIKTVVKKAGVHEGTFRLQPLQYLAGEKTKETIHKENNVRIKLDVEQVYFSPRLSTERRRIMQQVKPEEDILVMFAGCGPYTLELAKNTKARAVVGIEINPKGHHYAEENVKLNKLSNVTNYCGDVRVVVPQLLKKIEKKFDRVLMPLPMGGEHFLDVALTAVKSGGIIHFYDFLKEEAFPQEAIAKIAAVCKEKGRTYKVLHTTLCGQYAPRLFRVCIDAMVH
ncbi:class I SAM-dependent methyltransferase family protein [Candidatus Woesearchaeota archaeon]|nr:class I SAM-dependent methyltransferase family protein [Candidatus Woesearchaeota archaeon]